MSNFETAVNFVFNWEGFFSNHPKDTGGATKYGITQETLSSWRGKKVTVNDVKNLTLDESKKIYKARYWDIIKADELPKGLDLIAFDAAVNHGVNFAGTSLQKIAGLVNTTGTVDATTIKILSERNVAELIEFMAVLRKERYVTRENFKTFGRGWFNRLDDVTNTALKPYNKTWSAGSFLDFIAPDVDDFLSNHTLQRLLKEVDYYKGELDGLFGTRSIQAMSNFLLKEFGPSQASWPLERRKILTGQIFAKKANINVGLLDGRTGPMTKAAFEQLNYRLATGKNLPNWRDEIDLANPPIIVPQPSTIWPKETELEKFYGKRGENQTMLQLPYTMRLAWDLGTNVNRFSCHEKVHDPLKRIFQKTLDHYGENEIKRLRLDLFAGCLNVRLMQGSSTRWSTHSWGIAVDIDSANNQLRWGKDRASLARPAYNEFWKIVESEGGVSLGRALNYDWMHFQFARR